MESGEGRLEGVGVDVDRSKARQGEENGKEASGVSGLTSANTKIFGQRAQHTGYLSTLVCGLAGKNRVYNQGSTNQQMSYLSISIYSGHIGMFV